MLQHAAPCLGSSCLQLRAFPSYKVLYTCVQDPIPSYQVLYACVQDPNVEDPLNKEAAHMLSKDPSKFARLVRQSILEGVTIDGTRFPPCQHQPGRAR